jgi:cellulose synthase/poly-beta-1,6-N-acetylglucosamine synthase-like glycosyltransferase
MSELPQLEFNGKWFVFFLFSASSITVFFPVLSVLCYFFSFSWMKKKSNHPPASMNNSIFLNILVPAYREKDTLIQTLTSLARARQKLIGTYCGDKVTILLFLDGSDEETRRLAREFAAIHDFIKLNDRTQNLGKWKTLSELVHEAGSLNIEGVADARLVNWSCIVDSGTVWNEDFLLGLRAWLISSTKIGFAPGYFQRKSGLMEKMIWGQERLIKKIENLAGGPVSVHGATMVFRTDILKKVFAQLDYATWLNDDVVIALMSRAQGEVQYLSKDLFVMDCGTREVTSEFNRRKRIVTGNVEWVRKLWAPLIWRNPIVALIAARRVARIFWVYVFFGSVFSAVMSITNRFYCSFSVIALFLFLLRKQSRIWQAAKASLLAPFLLMKNESKVDWM